jgi:threonine aldolase
MRYADFRSDTVTKPTESMYKAMMQAVLGDDVYGDDPTINELEDYLAELLGKEAGLFVPSGTFANQLAIMTHTKRGDEIIVGENTHILQHEVGAAAVLSGVNLRTVSPDDGYITAEEVEKRLRGEDIHYPRTGLICIENAHSLGVVMPERNMKRIKELAVSHGIPVHMDGARFFNAAIALDLDFKQMASYADSINICLSKGLCAPLGSLLVGSFEYIIAARKNRKLMGGGMRQVGILGAAGLVALKEMIPRLAEDHKNAAYLAEKLEALPGISVRSDRLGINMVFFTLSGSSHKPGFLEEGLLKRGFIVNGPEGEEYRYVTNQGVNRQDIDRLISAMKEIL